MAAVDLPFDLSLQPDPNFKIPDVIQEFEGWRSWRVAGEVPTYGQAPKLYSATRGSYFWVPKRESRAECGKCDREDGEGVPGENCHCGFYSAKSREHLMTMSYHVYDGERDGMYCVIGRVANWGKVIEGSLGWRAELSYPVELFVPYEIWRLAKPLHDAYGIPVNLDNFLKPTRRRPI